MELDGLRQEKERLEHQRKKPLEAHYNDTIPLDLLKSEQQKITKQLLAIDHEIKAHESALTIVLERLGNAVELIEDCGRTYRTADDHIKRMMSQAIFSKIRWSRTAASRLNLQSPLICWLNRSKPKSSAITKKIRDTEMFTVRGK